MLCIQMSNLSFILFSVNRKSDRCIVVSTEIKLLCFIVHMVLRIDSTNHSKLPAVNMHAPQLQ